MPSISSRQAYAPAISRSAPVIGGRSTVVAHMLYTSAASTQQRATSFRSVPFANASATHSSASTSNSVPRVSWKSSCGLDT
jgi:hypothetical protein